MQVVMSKVFTDLDGVEVAGANGKPGTLRGITIDALLAVFQDEQNLSGEEKLKRWELAVKVKTTPDPVELAAEEISLIKKLIGKAYSALIVGQSFHFLEGKD
jgi:hypothetical protein